MASVDTGGDSGGGKKGKKRAKKSSTHIDMTPMVDLAFLLLTFFILTTTMSKPTTLQLTFPVDPKDDTSKITKVNNAITLILTKNDEILYYTDELKPETQFQKADYKSIRKVIQERNMPAIQKINELTKQFNKQVGGDKAKFKELEPQYKQMVDSIKGLKESVFCIIKPDEHAKYRNMIDIVDEMDICGVGKYAVSDKFAEAELEYIKNYLGGK
jgi:biopolymer transport protein ExbD